jgi:glutathione S-transferase
MILIGQYDSPFVRRVAVALKLYGHDYEHRPWSTFADGDRVAVYNPLRRVPVLVLNDGEVLIESAAILDYLDELAGPGALIPRRGLARREALKICALATGLCDKMVILVYERLLHAAVSEVWIRRCETQITSVLGALEQECAARSATFWFDNRIGHADIAVACAMRFLGEAHPEIAGQGKWPRLGALASLCEDLAVFRSVVQRFIPPASSR